MSFKMKMMCQLLASLMFVIGITSSTNTIGEIRCYCNDVSCVTTSYMCKSEIGACFSQLTYDGTTFITTHGCIEFLPVEERDLCNASGVDFDDVINARSVSTVDSEDDESAMLVCCNSGMCNYVDTTKIEVYINTKNNGSIQPEIPVQSNPSLPVDVSRGQHQYITDVSHQRELWFKAAVIAVPIAGGFILVLLVLMAVRLLRNDSQRIRHQLLHLHNEQQYQQHHQYYQYKQHAIGKAKLYEATIGDDPNTRHLVVGVPTPALHHHHTGGECIVDANTHCLLGGRTPPSVCLEETSSALDTPLYVDVESSRNNYVKSPQTMSPPCDSNKSNISDRLPGLSGVQLANDPAASIVTWDEHPCRDGPHLPASIV